MLDDSDELVLVGELMTCRLLSFLAAQWRVMLLGERLFDDGEREKPGEGEAVTEA